MSSLIRYCDLQASERAGFFAGTTKIQMEIIGGGLSPVGMASPRPPGAHYSGPSTGGRLSAVGTGRRVLSAVTDELRLAPSCADGACSTARAAVVIIPGRRVTHLRYAVPRTGDRRCSPST